MGWSDGWGEWNNVAITGGSINNIDDPVDEHGVGDKGFSDTLYTPKNLGMAEITDPALNAAVTTAIVNAYGGAVITLTGAGNAQTLQDPTDATAIKRFIVVVKGAFNIEVNGVTMTAGEAQHFIWDGASWVAISAVDADDITFTPTGNIIATEVQAAIEELDAEKLAEQAIGIADNNLIEIDDADAADDDYAKFTANGLEGRSASEAFGDIKQAASESATGVSERATDAEALAGTDTERHITPANLTAVLSRGINLIGTAGEAGFAVGICPPQLLPDGMIPLPGYDQPSHDNYGNYLFRDGSIMCWVPKFYYLIATNDVTIKGIDTYVNEQDANADNYALYRAFIDGGFEQQGFFFDKYQCSKNAWGTGDIASSIKDGLPLSTAADHNPIADLTACAGNFYYEAIKAAHARDGVNGAENASSIFHCASKFQYAALALLSLAHGQASSATTFCAWYDATYNYPKGCNNNALKDYDEVSNGAGSGDDLLYVTDGYSNCGKTGSGVPFAKSTHNGQNCGVADLNGLMYEISIGLTCIAPAAHGIEAITSAATPVFTWTGHGLSVGDYIMISGITQADWTNFKDKMWKVATVPDANTFTLTSAPDASGYAAYDAGADPGTFTKGVFYLAKEATAMKDFDSSNAGATDHWGATGVAAMMDSFTPVFESAYAGNGFSQRFGSGANQVLSEAVSGNAWLLTGLGLPKDADGIDTIGTNQFGKDYFYQYIRNELCVLSCGYWHGPSSAGVWAGYFDYYRTHAYNPVGFRAACYSE